MKNKFIHLSKSAWLFIALLPIAGLSCQVSTNEVPKVKSFNHYKFEDSSNDNLTLAGSGQSFVTISKTDESTTFTIDSMRFKNVSEFSANVLFHLTITAKKDSLFRGPWFCPTIDKAVFSLDGRDLPLSVNTFFNPTMMANEHYFLWHAEHGLVSIYEHKSKDLIIFEHQVPDDFRFQVLRYFRKRGL